MFEFIQTIDTWLFHLINGGIANPLFDKIMPFITENQHWLLVYIILFVWLLWKGGKTGRICAAVLIITIIISDQVSSSIIKDYVARLRPCHVLSDVRLLVPCGSGKSFPSSHAVNTFAAAVVLSHYYRKYIWLLFGIAATISFSRIYVGVHYPFDVIGGACFGLLVGYFVAFLSAKSEKFFQKKIKQRI
jgi:undecaprenyl-diphosphatase